MPTRARSSGGWPRRSRPRTVAGKRTYAAPISCATAATARPAAGRFLQRTLHDGLLLEQDAFVSVFATEDSQVGVKSFLEHGPGKAVFIGR